MNTPARVATAVAAAASCQAIQMAFLPAEGVRPGWPFFWAHLAFLALCQVAFALLLGAWREGRVWAAAAFVLPVALSLVSGRLFFSLPQTWVDAAVWLAALVAVGLAAVVGWPRAPWLSAGLGAWLACEVLRFRVDVFRGGATPAAGFVRPVITGLAVLVCLLWPAPTRRTTRVPGPGTVLVGGLASLALALSLHAADPWKAILARSARARARSGPSVVLIVLDTVRADRLRSYGGTRDVMPHLDAFGARYCLRAARSIAVHPSSLETHAAFLTGLTPPEHGAHRPRLAEGVDIPLYAHPLAAGRETLPELLAPAGYWSVGLSGNAGPLSPEFGLDQGFDVYRAAPEDVRRRSPWHVPLEWTGPALAARIASVLPASFTSFVSQKPYREASVITDEALAVLDAADDRGLFLFINYFDAHPPNAPPPPFLDAFAGRMPDSDLDGSYASTRRYYGTGVVPTPEEQRHMKALYDGELAYIDSELGRLLQRLQAHPRFAEMLVIVTADHGESLGEHGLVGHGHSLYEQQVSVPFFAKPGVVPVPVPAPGVLRDAVVQSTDVFALVLRQASLAVPEGREARLWGTGRSVTRAWSYCARDHSRWDPQRFQQELRSLEVGPLKLIASSRGSVELFDVVADPAEEHDLHEQRPGETALLMERLGPAEVPRARPAASATDDVEDDLQERLRSLGYVQ